VFSLDKFGINYWVALIVAPIVVGALGVVIERAVLRHLYRSTRSTGCCSPSAWR
jgi:branched-chain amino acid transport system permease protein